jgi:glucosamine--fructose-6-phosphate aminotransferase (isomerizing)
VKQVRFIGMGTAFYAGYIGSYLLEFLARIPAIAENGSELRYRNPIVGDDCLYLAVSQSGETADTIAAMKEIQHRGGRVLGICNVVGSTISRESNGGVYIHAGPEIVVASTKAFTS